MIAGTGAKLSCYLWDHTLESCRGHNNAQCELCLPRAGVICVAPLKVLRAETTLSLATTSWASHLPWMLELGEKPMCQS